MSGQSPLLWCQDCVYDDGTLVEPCALHEAVPITPTREDYCTSCLFRWDADARRFAKARGCVAHGGRPSTVDELLRAKRLKEMTVDDINEALLQLALDVEPDQSGATNRAGANTKLKALKTVGELKQRTGAATDVGKAIIALLTRGQEE